MRMSGKTDTSISEPLSKTDGSAPSRNPDLSYLSQRTMWARMISLSLPKYVNNLKSLQEAEIFEEYVHDKKIKNIIIKLLYSSAIIIPFLTIIVIFNLNI